MSRLRTSVFLIGGVVAVALAAGLSLFFGSTPILPDQVLGALFSPDMANQEHVAILELRGPRTVGCILVGAAFAVAGAIMQGVTRNPLADSGLLGINAGAAFALALCLALLPGMSFAGVVGCSFVGAAFALAVVFGAVSFRRRNVDPVLLVLAGAYPFTNWPAAPWGCSSRRSPRAWPSSSTSVTRSLSGPPAA